MMTPGEFPLDIDPFSLYTLVYRRLLPHTPVFTGFIVFTRLYGVRELCKLVLILFQERSDMLK